MGGFTRQGMKRHWAAVVAWWLRGAPLWPGARDVKPPKHLVWVLVPKTDGTFRCLAVKGEARIQVTHSPLGGYRFDVWPDEPRSVTQRERR